jgi:S-DNA-T family DNA segregation ATPase FtsK/SpoIIIE
MRRRYRRRALKFRLRKETVYSISAIFMLLFAVIGAFSYTKNGIFLTRVNSLLKDFFGFLTPLLLLNFFVLSLVLSRIRMRITKPNILLGLFVLTVCLFGLTKQGLFGQELYIFASSLFPPPLAEIIFAFGVLASLFVLTNLSIGDIYRAFKAGFVFTTNIVKKRIFPLLKTRSIDIRKIQQPVLIKGLEESRKSPPPPKQTEEILEKKPQELSSDMVLNKPLEIGIWEYPPLTLLSDREGKKADRGDIKKIADTIEDTLRSFNIKASVVEINLGPAVTQYALEIALGTKLSKITSLANDLALATEAPTGQIRIEAPIPGRKLVGIEIPNRSLEVVSLKTMLASPIMQKAKSKLTVPLGLDVSGNPVIADIAKMPHVLIAGTTGSGKSVLMNSLITSLLFRASPSEVKMILIDPKRVELTMFNDIPHLLTPVVVEPQEAVSALKWAMKEMDKRYVKFAEAKVRNIDSYNELAGFQALPYIVIFIDELADLMSLAPVEVEDSIARLAQMARATGIHLVVSTQRPSVDVITGLIKANIPCRIAFNVSSMVDSKVIIDMPGAEKLLGRGDMLFIPPDQAKPTRIQGAFVSENDVKRVVNFIKAKNIPIEYTKEVVEQKVALKRGAIDRGFGEERDELFREAVRIVCQYDRASSSLLQRRLSIGFSRAARILDQLEAAGVVGPGEGPKPREVLIKNPDQFLATLEE